MPTVRIYLAALICGMLAMSVQAADLPQSADLARYDLQMAWWGRASIDPAREKVDYVVNDEEMVFVRSTTGVITAFDAETGRKAWASLIGRPDQVSYAPVSNTDQLLVAVGLNLIAVSKKTGETIWELRLPKHPSAPPAVDTDQMYLGMVDGSVYGYDLKIVQQLHEERRLPAFSHNAMLWRYQTPSEIVSPPISTGRSVSFASSSGSLYSVSAKEQKLVFQFECDAKIMTPLGRNEKSILLAAENSRMFCLDQDNGQFRWAFTSAYPIRQQPRFFGSRVYVTPESVGTFALNADSGAQMWEFPQAQARRVLMVGQNRLYAVNAQNEIVILEASDGKVIGKLSYRHFTKSPTNDRTDRMFLATQDGLLVCLKERGSAIPTFHLHPERRPILPELTPEEGEAAPADPNAPAAAPTAPVEPAVENQ